MGVIIGIDVGGSTTKIVGFTADKQLVEPLFVRATDPVTSLYGAFGKFTEQNGIALTDISDIKVTGVGSTFIKGSLYSLKCHTVPEFTAVGLGGLYLSGLDNAIVVSMGTGTAIIHAEKDKLPNYLGGTGVGGGTLLGLSQVILGMDNIDHIIALADDGDLNKIDLRIQDIANSTLPLLNETMTAANFGKVSDIASKADIALGIINMVFETIGMQAIFASRNCGVKDIVLTGNLTYVKHAKPIFETLNNLFDINFIIPDNARYGTVIGAALAEI